MAANVKFYEILERVFTHPDLFKSQSDWASVLMVSRPAITQYKKGAALPKAGTLGMIRSHLQTALPPQDPVRQEFEAGLTRPVSEIGINSNRVHEYRTLDDYLVLPLLKSFEEALHLLPVEERKQALVEAADIVWKRVESAQSTARL